MNVFSDRGALIGAGVARGHLAIRRIGDRDSRDATGSAAVSDDPSLGDGDGGPIVTRVPASTVRFRSQALAVASAGEKRAVEVVEDGVGDFVAGHDKIITPLCGSVNYFLQLWYRTFFILVN